ncbi:MAG: acylneuraminate cytidylyltransferase family protein [Lachnospiraceae bacterium]|nr:acylneuraminate cytidylyltransferase family protein [Lachnospiraceae bacterium]
MRNIAIIPARSGSKGLKDKNIKLLAGKPMIAYTIEAAKEAGIFDCIHVSTDSGEYARIAKEFGADVPFLRSDVLSGDTAGSWDVVRWVMEQYAKLGQEFDCVTLLQPTSPLRTGVDIQNAYRVMQEKQADAVVAVCEMEHSPLWSNTLPENGNMNGFLDRVANIGRQKLPDYYRINGAVYMLKTSLLEQAETALYREGTYAYQMPKERSVDIDDAFDFAIAEAIMNKYGL